MKDAKGSLIHVRIAKDECRLEAEMSDMIEVMIDSIRVSLISQQRIVILRELNAERYLPIWIGIYEADAITLALQETEVARPLTWDLLKNTITSLGARIIRVEVLSLRDDTYYGNIVTELNGQVINIDSRPSDALALAVRTHVPILVAREVMDTAGVEPDEDLQESSEETREALQQPPEEGEARLSVFEDFLDQLDISDEDKKSGAEDDEEQQ
jgi:bifunctional DNase/RNase